jgi:putative CocE/NonD family hydrolase
MAEYQRISKYYKGCDGVLLAADLYIPATDKPVPLLMQCGYFNRRTQFEMQKADFERFMAAGYAVALLEPRGNGASFGISEGFFDRNSGKDIGCVLDAMTAEDWCTGCAGMLGGSNLGQSQQLALAAAPKSLKAVIPQDANPNFYYQNYTNGASSVPDRPGFQESVKPGVPVDEDKDGSMAEAAANEHSRNMGFLKQYLPNMYRNSVNHKIGYAPNLDISAWEKNELIRHNGIHIYQVGGWYDPGCTGEMLGYKAWGGRLRIGPWGHVQASRDNTGYDLVADQIAFFNAVLKGEGKDYLEAPPISYYTLGENKWHYAADLPLDNQAFMELRLGADGVLGSGESGQVEYRVTEGNVLYDGWGKLNRRVERDLSELDKNSAVWTGAPLEKDLELTGIASLELKVSSTHADGNFIAVLEELRPDGFVSFLTDGCVRASHSKLGRNSAWDAMGLPYHRSFKEDAVSLSETVATLLAFNLEGISIVVPKGSRLRLSVHCRNNIYSEPPGCPAEAPTVKFHCPSVLKLPVINPCVTRFEGRDGVLYAFKRAVYLYKNNSWQCWPCRQVYPAGEEVRFETESFTAYRRVSGNKMTIRVPELDFYGEGSLPDRLSVKDTRLWVAAVPVPKEAKGQMNPQPLNTLDLYIDLKVPETSGKHPCVVYIHGFGEPISISPFSLIGPYLKRFLDAGIAVASIDYRLSPPAQWPVCGDDAKGAIRFLKANAAVLGLDENRFAVFGGSMGGHLATMIAACNGDKLTEGSIGGNTEQNSSVKVAAAFFPFTDFFGFGDDCAKVWPLQPDKVARCDGPDAPLGNMIGYFGQGKGMGELKPHLFDTNPYYQDYLHRAVEASPISHVTENSAPLALVHGIYDCPIQVPMGQSERMFETYTRKGVKSLLLCNNNGIYGSDPEIQEAVFRFIINRL